MIQRAIYQALVQGLANIVEEPDILYTIFEEQWGLPRAEVDGIKDTVLNTHPIKVGHGYANVANPMPWLGIVLKDERETENFLGDVAEPITDEDDPDYRSDLYAALWSHSYNLNVHSEHPDVTLYYYEIAKHTMLASIPFFNDQGIHEVRLSGGDISPSEKYHPAHLFIRQLTVQCGTEFQRIDRRAAKGFTISGIHVDKTGLTSDVGDVQTNVTPYVGVGNDS